MYKTANPLLCQSEEKERKTHLKKSQVNPSSPRLPLFRPLQ